MWGSSLNEGRSPVKAWRSDQASEDRLFGLAKEGFIILIRSPRVFQRQVMQTQAQTQAALQAQLQAQAQAPAPVPQEHGHGGPSIMERFKRMVSPPFKGESQPLLAESWMREVEKIF
ncbi:hypothetical protein Taro_022348, partial [Colocasia esculenta]|nr:hypothetical protein [Colocasia esculenta]